MQNEHSSNQLTVSEIKSILCSASIDEFESLKALYSSDGRAGVIRAITSAQKTYDKRLKERARLKRLYDFEQTFLSNPHGIILGLDEVGRGPLAGPLAVGGVVLSHDSFIEGLNDSKKIAHKQRLVIADDIKKHALAYTVEYVQPDVIDAYGMTYSLKLAFSNAIKTIEGLGFIPDVILLDGNPLHLDSREINIIKGDGKCASIAAASIVAKVTRDQLMVEYAKLYPEYHLDSCKGYASAEHIQAIKNFGLSPIHRKSFCTHFVQESLF